jgi:hypothetical protein
MKMRAVWRAAKRLLIHGGSARLRPYEKACIEAWRALLTVEGLLLLDQQLERLSFLQRQANGKLLCFYDINDKSAEHWPDSLLFPCRLTEALAARVTLRPASKECASPIKADIMLCKGRFFGLEFSKSPAFLANGFEVVKSDALLDPMLQLSEGGAGDIMRERLIATIDAKLPDEYLALVADAGTTVINGWQIYDLPQVRKIVQPEENYYLVAEKERRGAIGVREEDQSGQLYYLDYEDDVPVKIQISLRAFCESDEATLRRRPDH